MSFQRSSDVTQQTNPKRHQARGSDLPPSEAEVLAAVEQSGYLMEQEVACLLEAAGFHVQPSWPYEDPREGKSREIDVRAVQPLEATPPYMVFAELYCECKSASATPFVFLTRRKGAIDELLNPVHFCFPHESYEVPDDRGSRVVTPFSHLGLAKHHPWWAEDGKAVQFVKIVKEQDRWKAKHDDVYDALLLPLGKALASRRNAIKGSAATSLCFPVIVVRTDLYTLDTQASPRRLTPQRHVTLLRRFDSTDVTGDHLFTFVREDAIGEFVNTVVMPFARAVAEIAAKNPTQLTKKRHDKPW